MNFRNKLERLNPFEITKQFRMSQTSNHLSSAQPIQSEHADILLEVERDGITYKTGVFSKGFKHNQFGEVPKQDWMDLLMSLRSGKANEFADISLNPTSQRKLVSPQAAYRYSYMGQDTQSITMPLHPDLNSNHAAGEMMEVYEMAMHRDVPFIDIQNGVGPTINRATQTLNNYGNDFYGPKDNGNVTNRTLFRGPNTDELIGPYVSQFLVQPYDYGNTEVNQKVKVEADVSNTVTTAGFLAVQDGEQIGSPNFTGDQKYIYSPRVLASYVHNDPVFQAYCTAGLIAFQNNIPLDDNTPISNTEAGFVTFGLADIVLHVAHVAQLALQTAWHHKWIVNLRLRPEVMAARFHFTNSDGLDYGIDPNSHGTNTLLAMEQYNQVNFGSQTRLLPLVFPEGSPAHPSYPAGHATIAGACTTVLKAFFKTDLLLTDVGLTPMHSLDGDSLIPYAEADAGNITVLGEFNKLASNIATGRNMAGVHYRSDGDLGILLGEELAISYLFDLKQTYNETFDGWNLTKFDGSNIII